MGEFREAGRSLSSVLAPLEKRTLLWLAAAAAVRGSTPIT